jgi:hypothetical protein
MNKLKQNKINDICQPYHNLTPTEMMKNIKWMVKNTNPNDGMWYEIEDLGYYEVLSVWKMGETTNRFMGEVRYPINQSTKSIPNILEMDEYVKIVNKIRQEMK